MKYHITPAISTLHDFPFKTYFFPVNFTAIKTNYHFGPNENLFDIEM